MTDWTSIREQFPVTRRFAYLNSAAAGPVSIKSHAAATDYYQKMMSDGDVHWFRWLAEREAIRARIAKFINAEPDEIAFTTNTSSGMNVIVDALEERGEVISCELEFPVTTLPWMHRRIPVHLVRATNGEVRIDDIRAAMTQHTGVIALSHVQFSNGFRIDLEELGRIKGDHALVINASQSAGVFEIDVKRMSIDALCATGHKWLLSGYGSGFVYLSRESVATDFFARAWLVERRRAFRDAQRRIAPASRCCCTSRAWLPALCRHVLAGRCARADRTDRHREHSGARASVESVPHRQTYRERLESSFADSERRIAIS